MCLASAAFIVDVLTAHIRSDAELEDTLRELDPENYVPQHTEEYSRRFLKFNTSDSSFLQDLVSFGIKKRFGGEMSTGTFVPLGQENIFCRGRNSLGTLTKEIQRNTLILSWKVAIILISRHPRDQFFRPKTWPHRKMFDLAAPARSNFSYPKHGLVEMKRHL